MRKKELEKEIKRLRMEVDELRKKVNTVEIDNNIYYISPQREITGFGRIAGHSKSIKVKEVVRFILDKMDLKVGEAEVSEKIIKATLVKKENL